MTHFRLFHKITLFLLVYVLGVNQAWSQTCPTSNEITITVVAAPNILLSGETTICSGGSATLTAATTGGAGTCTVQWQISTNNGVSFTDIAGATSATYTTPALTATTQYRATYTCTGGSCPQATSNIQTITVNSDPTITTQPVDITQCVGGTTPLTVAVSGGAGTLTYQWQSSILGVLWNNISGATSATYTPSSATAGTTLYRVVVNATGDGCGTATSSVATVTTVAPVAITSQPSNFSACIGSTQALSVTATGGTPSLTYQWESSADGLGGWTAIAGATSNTYIPDASVASTTYYRVKVGATGGGCSEVTSSTATVVINPELAISTQPVGFTECQGGTQALTVAVTGGAPSVTYQWQQEIAGIWTPIIGATNSSYTPVSLLPGTYNYRVIVDATGNSCTAVTSSVATVIVTSALAINVQPISVNACVGGLASLSVGTTAGLTAGYQWQSSTNGVLFTDVAGATSATFNPPTTTAGTTFYRVVVNAAENGCTTVISTAATVIVAPSISITAQPNNITECIGGTEQLLVSYLGGVPGLVTLQWQSSTTADGSSGWTNISGATSGSFTPSSGVAGTTYYRVLVGSGGNGCDPLASVVVGVTIVPPITITAAPTDIAECVGGTDALSVTATGGTNLTYQWQSSTTGLIWTNISGATGTTYTPDASTAGTTYYRVVVSSTGNGCAAATSATATVVVNPNIAITAQPADITECVGGTAALSVTATGGAPSLTYQWQSSTTADGSSGWTNISGATSNTYVPDASTVGTTYYRVLVNATGAACTAATSTTASVTVQAGIAIATQPADITECVGGTAPLSVTATGGTNLTYQWQSEVLGLWTNILGATSSSYTPATLLAGTTNYRVIVSDASSGCGSITSATATVTVVSDVLITAVSSDIDQCVGGNAALSVTTTGGAGTLTYQWQSSANGTSGWANISGATASTYTPDASVAGTTYYRVIVGATGSGCGPATSSAVRVVVNPAITISAEPTSFSECVGGVTPLTVTATGGVSLTYQWQIETTPGVWTNISGATASSYIPDATTAGTTNYRVIVASTGSNCSSATSATATVTVNPDIVISAQPTDLSQCVGGTASISVTVTGGVAPLTYQWQSSTNGLLWTSISGATSATYTPNASTAGVTYYRVVVDAGASGCTAVTSATSTVTITPTLTITANPNNVSQCIGGTDVLSVSVSGGVSGAITYQWFSSPDNGMTAWAPISGATSATYTPSSAVAGTMYYRVEVTSTGSACGAQTSAAAVVEILPNIAITTNPADITECIGGTDVLSATVVGGTTPLSYQWQISIAGIWTNIIGATSATYTPASILSGTTQYRVIVSAGGSGCASATSAAATVTVVAKPTVATVANATQVCPGGGVQLDATTTGGTGCTVIWQSSTTINVWNDIPGATGNSYITPPITSDTKFRARLQCSGSGCCN